MWVFEHPETLLLLPVLPVAVWARHFRRRRGAMVRFPFAVWGEKETLHTPFGVRLGVILSAICFWTGGLLLVLAISGPTVVSRERVFLNPGVDMMIILDESPTMSAKDFAPVNRFESAKNVIGSFVERRESDAIGLVSFGAEAALRVPPTLDYERLLARLDDLTVMDLGDGTAIGMGLAVGILHLRSSSAEQKVLILLTDGVNNAGDIPPETAAGVAADLGMRIYAIGIGTDEETAFEFTDPADGRTYRGTLRESFDEDLLRRIAELSGGGYFYAGSPGALAAVFRSIDSIETVERRARTIVRSEPRQREILLLALMFFASDFLLRKVLMREIL